MIGSVLISVGMIVGGSGLIIWGVPRLTRYVAFRRVIKGASSDDLG